MNIDLHVYVLAELVEHGHQRVNGEAVKLYVANGAKIGMTDTGTEFSLARRKPFIVRMPMVRVARSALAYRPPGPEIRFIRSQALNPVTWSGLQNGTKSNLVGGSVGGGVSATPPLEPQRRCRI